MAETLLIKPEEAMELLGVGRNKMYCDLLKRDDFPCMRVGRNYYINKLGLQDWINEQCKKKSA